MGKWKPAELLQEAYDAGHRDFGENYVQVEAHQTAPSITPDCVTLALLQQKCCAGNLRQGHSHAQGHQVALHWASAVQQNQGPSR